jgi:hypothetical protein
VEKERGERMSWGSQQKEGSAGNRHGLIDKAEAARQIGGNKPVSVSFVNQLLARKLLPRVRISYRVTRIPQDAVTEYIRTHTVNARDMKAVH